jgi:hypothetical protein
MGEPPWWAGAGRPMGELGHKPRLGERGAQDSPSGARPTWGAYGSSPRSEF